MNAVSPIGPLPKGWQLRPLKELTTKIGSGATPRGGSAAYLEARLNYALIRSQCVFDRSLDLSTLSFIDDAQAKSLSGVEVRSGDLLLNITGDGITFGRCCMVNDAALPAVVNQHVAIIRPDTEILAPGYLLSYLVHPEIKNYVEGFNAGGSRRALTKGHIENFQIAFPPLPEQRAIAATLGALDDKIELNRKMNATLESIARALFRDWFVDFGPTRAKMQGRAPYLSPDLWPLFPDRLDAEGKPEGWEVRPVGDFAVLKGGKQLEKEYIADAGPVPVFGGAGLLGYTANHNADGFVISVGRVGAYCGQFFSHRGRAWINNNASLVRPNPNVSGEWLLIALRHIDMDVIKKGAAQPFVSNGDIAKVGIMWPGSAIISAFSEALVSLIRKAEANERESRTLAQTRDLLLPRLMSGELRVAEAESLTSEVA